LLTGEHPYTDRDPVGGVLTLNPGLPTGVRELLARACSPRFEDRFRSAQDFIQALVALGVDEVPMPLPPLNVMERMKGIQNAVAERRWEDALALCPAEWKPIHDMIVARQDLDQAADEQEPLLEIDGFSLRFVGTRRFTTAANTAGVEVGAGRRPGVPGSGARRRDAGDRRSHGRHRGALGFGRRHVRNPDAPVSFAAGPPHVREQDRRWVHG
jgi:hypothetical protein